MPLAAVAACTLCAFLPTTWLTGVVGASREHEVTEEEVEYFLEDINKTLVRSLGGDERRLRALATVVKIRALARSVDGDALLAQFASEANESIDLFGDWPKQKVPLCRNVRSWHANTEDASHKASAGSVPFADFLVSIRASASHLLELLAEDCGKGREEL